MEKDVLNVIAWLFTFIAVIFGIISTGSAFCLWAFSFPVILKVMDDRGTDDK